ncbi:MAG: hypothetical protein M3065_20535 [Actinomycetota bacterium]|nr:hypothetical protein [Actinomycetota bacterium]
MPALSPAAGVVTGSPGITSDGRSADPVWGTRGAVFDHKRFRKGDAPIAQIWLMQANGGGRRQITHKRVGLLVKGLVPITFSADGTRLAAEFEGQDTSFGYSVSAHGASPATATRWFSSPLAGCSGPRVGRRSRRSPSRAATRRR